jgi:hypothetical protein
VWSDKSGLPDDDKATNSAHVLVAAHEIELEIFPDALRREQQQAARAIREYLSAPAASSEQTRAPSRCFGEAHVQIDEQRRVHVRAPVRTLEVREHAAVATSANDSEVARFGATCEPRCAREQLHLRVHYAAELADGGCQVLTITHCKQRTGAAENRSQTVRVKAATSGAWAADGDESQIDSQKYTQETTHRFVEARDIVIEHPNAVQAEIARNQLHGQTSVANARVGSALDAHLRATLVCKRARAGSTSVGKHNDSLTNKH